MPRFHSSGNYYCPRIVVREVEIDPLDSALPSWRHDMVGLNIWLGKILRVRMDFDEKSDNSRDDAGPESGLIQQISQLASFSSLAFKNSSGGFVLAEIETLQSGPALQNCRDELEKISAAFARAVIGRLHHRLVHSRDAVATATQCQQSLSRRGHLQYEPAVAALGQPQALRSGQRRTLSTASRADCPKPLGRFCAGATDGRRCRVPFQI
jgi:hypothetical protein